MKNLIRTYVDPILEDRLKLLAESSGVSLSSLTAELIYLGLEHTTTKTCASEVAPSWLEEILYLQYLNLKVSIQPNRNLDKDVFEKLRLDSQTWAAAKVKTLSHRNEEDKL